MSWIPVKERLPELAEVVAVVCQYTTAAGSTYQYQTIAEHIPHMTVKEDNYMKNVFCGEGDYNEENDTYYMPAGWYEYQAEAGVKWSISTTVTHWRPLFELPEKVNL